MAPASVLANGRVWIFYRDKDGDRILSTVSDEADGLTFSTPSAVYTG